MANKTDNQLQEILSSQERFTKEAVLAAAIELKSRGITSDQIQAVSDQLTNQISQEASVNSFLSKLNSKQTIYIFAFLLTPLIAGPMLISNLIGLRTKNGISTVILLMTLHLVISVSLVYALPTSLLWILSIFHLTYCTFLVEYIWKRYIPSFKEYEGRKSEEFQ